MSSPRSPRPKDKKSRSKSRASSTTSKPSKPSKIRPPSGTPTGESRSRSPRKNTSTPKSPGGGGRKRKSGKTASTPLHKPKTPKTPNPNKSKSSKSSKHKKPKLDTKTHTNPLPSNSNSNKHPDIDNRRNLSPKNSPNNKRKHKHSPKNSSKSNGNHTSSKNKKRSFYGNIYSTKTKGKLQTLYKVKEKIGSGTFSTVRRGIRRSDKKEIAIKIITKTDLTDTEARLIKREIGVMQKLDHANIVKLYDIFETSHHLYLIVEYCRGGELFDELINCTPSGWFSEREASQIIKQIAKGLHHMHQKQIIHRDLKLENVLVSMKTNYQINTKQMKFSIDNQGSSDMEEMSATTNENEEHSKQKGRRGKKKNKKKGARPRVFSSHIIKFQSSQSNNNVFTSTATTNTLTNDEHNYSDSNSADMDGFMTRRHSECISAIPHDLLYGNNMNGGHTNDKQTSIIIKISDFGLSKKLKRNEDEDINEQKDDDVDDMKRKKDKVNGILNKHKHYNKEAPLDLNGHVNDRQFAVMATNCGTLYYVAPEILNNEPYNEKVDMWSLGVICYVLLCGSLPFYSENELEISDMILACQYDLGETDDHWLKVSDSAKDLIKKLLTLDKVNRLSATQVLQHPFITKDKKLHCTKRKSVKWNAGALLGKWPMKFRNMLDSAKQTFANESDIDSDIEANEHNVYGQPSPRMAMGQKVQFKINYSNSGNHNNYHHNANYLDSPYKNGTNGLSYSDVSELESEQSAVE